MAIPQPRELIFQRLMPRHVQLFQQSLLAAVKMLDPQFGFHPGRVITHAIMVMLAAWLGRVVKQHECANQLTIRTGQANGREVGHDVTITLDPLVLLLQRLQPDGCITVAGDTFDGPGATVHPLVVAPLPADNNTARVQRTTRQTRDPLQADIQRLGG